MVKGKLSNGFEFEINEEDLDDYEVLELVSDAELNPLLSPKLIERFLGREQKNKLLNHIKEKTGKKRVTVSEMGEAFTEILTKSQELKN